MARYKKAIKSMLSDVVGEDLGNKIFEANFPKPITNYKRGKVLTFKELKELSEGTIIHIRYLNEEYELSEDGFHELSKGDTEYSGGGFPFPMDEHDSDDDLVKDRDNCGHTFTISEAIKTTKAEYLKIEKLKEQNIRAVELITKLRDEEPLTKEEKKELKKITGIYVK